MGKPNSNLDGLITLRKVYERLTWEKGVANEVRYLAIRDLCLKYQVQELVDLGCGKGIVEYLLPDSLHCLGVDVDNKMLHVAREINKQKSNREFINCDIRSLYEIHRKFQCALITEVLEHLKDDEEPIKIARSLLKDDGILILTVPNIQRTTNRFHYLLSRQVVFQHKTHVREYGLHDVIGLLQRGGFRVVELRGLNLQLPKEKYLPRNIINAFPFFKNIITRFIPSLANSLLLVARKEVIQ